MRVFNRPTAFTIAIALLAAAETPLRAAADESRQPSVGPGAKTNAALDDLQSERLVAARQFFDATELAFERDTVTLDIFVAALGERRAAELDAASTPAERLEAHRRAIAAADALARKIEALHTAGARGGEAEKMWRSRLVRIEAQIALGQEQASSGGDKAGRDEGAASEKPKDVTAIAEKLAELTAERLEAARKFLEAARAAYESDTVTMELVIAAVSELLETELAAATAANERITAYVHAIATTQALVTRVKALHEAHARGGEMEKLAHLRSVRLGFDVRLARERQQQAADAATAEK